MLNGLDPSQLDAVTATDGTLRVQAGAGTGKTRVLTTRAAYLVQEKNINPSRVVAVTFTVKAAREMRERAVALGGDALAGLRMSTIHSLAAHVLRKHWKAAGLKTRNAIIADDEETKSVLLRAIQTTGILGEEQPKSSEWKKVRDSYLKECEQKISRWKENGLSAADILNPSRTYGSLNVEDYARVYVEYDREMQTRDLLDFADLTLKSINLFEQHPEILKQEASQIEYLMVDEFQDTNQVQLKFIAQLSSYWKNFMVVGDNDQSIYSFRGSLPSLMDRVGELLPDLMGNQMKTVALINNRRCTEQILKPANLLVDYNQRDEPKVLNSGRLGEEVAVNAYANCRLEADGVAILVENLIAKGVNPAEIAVLGRTGYVLNKIGISMIEKRIPHSMQSGSGLLERKEIRDILAYLKLAINPELDVAFERIIMRPTRGLGASALEQTILIARNNKVSFSEALAMLADTGKLKASAKKSAVQLSRQLAVLSDAAQRGESSETIVRYVLDEIGYSDWALKDEGASKNLMQSIDAILSIAHKQTEFMEFINDMCLLNDPGADERSTEGVHIGTLHGSKGLEWEHVFIVAFEEGVIPNPRALKEAEGFDRSQLMDKWNTTNSGGLEEERRLAHVGMTRAKETLNISFAASREGNGKTKENRPSRFLREAELPIPKPKSNYGVIANGMLDLTPKGKSKQMKTVQLF